MGTAAVLGVNHMPVGGDLVGADPEHHPECPAERQEKATFATLAPGCSGHRRTGTVFTVVPALRGIATTPQAQHLAAAEPDLGGDVIDVGVAGPCTPAPGGGRRPGAQADHPALSRLGEHAHPRAPIRVRAVRSDLVPALLR